MVGEIGVVADDGFAGGDILRLELVAIGGEDEADFLAGGLGAAAQGRQGVADGAGEAGGDVDVAALEDGAGDV